MLLLNAYLDRYFVDAERFAEMCRLSHAELADLIRHRLIPKPSYVVSDSHLASFVFGRVKAEGAKEGEYFPPAHRVWVAIARAAVDDVGMRAAHRELEQRFAANLVRALRDLNGSTWRLRDSFADDGSMIEQGVRARTDSMWTHFLEGTFGLCVADPSSEASIARKEILQEKLTALSENGVKQRFSHEEASMLRELIEAYSNAAMPFSPIEFPVSSRKRLVDDLLARIERSVAHEPE